MPYMPSKAGVIHMVKHLAFELGEYRIRVNAILPGPFVTNIADGHLKNPVVRKAWDDATLMGRIADTWQIKPLSALSGVRRIELCDRHAHADRRRHGAGAVRVAGISAQAPFGSSEVENR